MPTIASALGCSLKKSAPPTMVSSGMNPMIGCTADTSPRLSAAERQSMPPTSFGITTANARQKVGVVAGHGPASVVAIASSTPPTARNATVVTMRDMDGARAEQVGRSPRRHGGDVRRERDHRGREAVEAAELHRRD